MTGIPYCFRSLHPAQSQHPIINVIFFSDFKHYSNYKGVSQYPICKIDCVNFGTTYEYGCYCDFTGILEVFCGNL